MQKRIAIQSLSVLTLASFVPSVLAINASEKYEPPRSMEVSDTGICRVRTGKTVIRANLPKVATDRQALRLSLDGFRIEGDPRLMPEALDSILAPWKGRELSFVEYEAAIHAVAQYLRENGHPGAQVRMSRAIVGRGQVMIAIEGLTPGKTAVAEAEVKPRVDVKGFKITGATLASEAELQSLLTGYAGKPITAAEMEQAAQSVANHLRAKGYPLVQAFLPPQRVDDGMVEIAVLEGRVDPLAGHDGVIVDSSGQRVKPDVVEAFIARGAKPGEPLRVADLERAVLIASDLPGLKSVKTEIEPGTQSGTTQVKVKVDEGKLVSSSLWLDNYGNRYTGTTRGVAQFLLNSPLGHGEQYGLNLVASEGSHSVRLQATTPVGTSGLRLGAAFASIDADFGLDMRTIDLVSSAKVASLTASYPLIRSAEQNLNLSGSLDHKRYVTDLTWGRENDRRLTMGTVGLSGDLLDRWGGQTKWSTALAAGNVDLSAHLLNEITDSQGPRTAGEFAKFNWQASRLAPLHDSSKWSWLLATSGQYASKNLDSAEKFQLGGPQGVRAYPVSEGIGDHGWIVNAELRYRLPESIQRETHLFGFFDAGGITQYANPWVGALGASPNDYTLKGAGVGANVSFGDSGSVKLMWAKKIGDNPNPTPSNTDSDGLNKSSRVWILGNIVF